MTEEQKVKIVSRSEYTTVVSADVLTYTISQSPGKGIELLIESTEEKALYVASRGKTKSPFTIRLWIPKMAKSAEHGRENFTELSIWPIPKEVLKDIEKRTKGDLYVEDISDIYTETEPGKEFYIKTNGDILLTNM